MLQKKPKKNISKDTEIEEIEVCPKAKDGSTHHWVIDPPNGPVSTGTCKKCGEQKDFKNSVEFSSWYGSKSDFDSKKKKTDKTGKTGKTDSK
jgi:hypothetical protein